MGVHMGEWKNQYMELVRSKPGLIFAEENRALSDSCRAEVTRRCSAGGEVYLELGSGSGGHLLELAGQNPQALCIGFELRFKRTFRTAEKAERQGLSNVMMIRSDARMIGELFSDSSLDRIYLNYPDPWDRKRWFKHRLVNLEFMAALQRLLKPGGIFSHRTDHHDYFSETLRLLTDCSFLEVVKSTTDLDRSEYSGTLIPTEFERLFRSQSLNLCYAEARRREGGE